MKRCSAAPDSGDRHAPAAPSRIRLPADTRDRSSKRPPTRVDQAEGALAAAIDCARGALANVVCHRLRAGHSSAQEECAVD